jgi:[ribosomal protein S5]-alanine N-acetyltransferase
MTLAIGDDHIETERLLLRRVSLDDLPFYTRIHADPEVARYIGPGRPRTVEESRRWLETTLETYASVQLGQLAVIRKADGALIGRAGTSYLEIDATPADGGAPSGYFAPGEAPTGIATFMERELGYTFDRSAWGQGYAREAAGAVFDYVSKQLRVNRVVSLIDSKNVRSQRVAGSLGARHVDRVRAFDRLLDRYVWPTN